MIIHRKCGMCQGGCHVKVTVEDGRITRVEADQDYAQGRVCARGALTPELLYARDRISHPLIRVGEKGEGKFRKATWDEALDYAAELLNKTRKTYGARALASYQGRGILGMPIARIFSGKSEPCFMKRLGSPNDFNAGSICNMASSTVTPLTTSGLNTRQMIQDVAHSEYIFIWGKNPMTDCGPRGEYQRIREAKKRGAKIVVIDPRKTGMGELADLWIPVIPGADGALALAMLKLIIEQERYDKDFVSEYTRGFEEFRKYVETLELNDLSRFCGISVEQIKALTDLFCSTEKISLIAYTGLEYQLSGIQNNRAIFTLWAITGKLDVEGGIYFNCQSLPTFLLYDLPEENQPIGMKEFPMFYKFMEGGQFCRFPEAVLNDNPYPVRALLLAGGSPVLTFPDSTKWREVYTKLDCLIVSDRYMTEDARFADVVFPASTMFETWSLTTGADGRQTIQPPAVEPFEECRDDVLIFSALAKRLGIGDDYPGNEEELKEWLLNGSVPYANDWKGPASQAKRVYRKYEKGLLRRDGKSGFPTPSGKFEICSVYLEENGFTPYPEYQDMRSIPEMDSPEYPFTMTTGARSMHRMGVFGANLPGIVKLEPYPYMDLSPEDAGELGLTDGAWARVTTPFGTGRFKVRVCEIARYCIHIPHGGGSEYMTEAWKVGNVNELTSLAYNDPITGFVTIKSVPCKVEKE